MTESQPSTSVEYLVLDTWALCDFTRGSLANNLSNLVNELNLTILVDSYTLVELYNPGWFRMRFVDRTRAASEFLVDHRSCLVAPQQLLLEEVRAFPSRRERIPIATDLHSLHWSTREYLLGGLFRRDDGLVSYGLDLQAWAKDYKLSKGRWPATVQAIINEATSAGLLRNAKDGTIDVAGSDKEAFLRYLDRRFLKFEHHRDTGRQRLLTLAENVRDLSHGATAQLPAVRLTSLAFWHAYIQADKAFLMPCRGSDLGDIYRFALVPYCSYFTVDSAMDRVLKRVLAESPQTATILSPATFKGLLDQYAPEPGALLRY
jgi:hypothetical protein